MMKEHFGAADFAVFLGTLGISVSIGIFFAIRDKRKKRNAPDDYFLAGRKSKVLPVALSFTVTFQSSLLILAVPAEIYANGMHFLYITIGQLLSFVFAGLFIVPVFYPLKITSVYKYFYLRYGDNLLRYLAFTTAILYNIFYMGTVIYGTCVAADVVVGIPYWGTVLLYTIVATIYTSIGGIIAVIWTDVFQVLIMFLGIVSVLIKTTIDAGGVSRVTELAHDRLYMGDVRFDPTVRVTVWNVTFGSVTIFLYMSLTQSAIQRINSTPDIQSARRTYITAAPVYAVFVFMAGYEGVTIFAYYVSKGCDIYNVGLIKNINALLPVTVIELFHTIPGISGLFIAALSSATLSTLSSCLNSLSAITYEDFIKVIFPHIDNVKATRLSKIAVLIYGLVAMAITFLFAKLPGSIIDICISFMGCIDGPTVAMFLLSIFFKRGTSKGIFVGVICGMGVSFWIMLGKTFSLVTSGPTLPAGPLNQCYRYANRSYMSLEHSSVFEALNETLVSPNNTMPTSSEQSVLNTLYSISYMLYSLIGCVVTLIISVLISLCTKPPPQVDEKYMFSFQKHIVRDLCGLETQTHSVKTDEDDVDPSDEESKELTTSH